MKAKAWCMIPRKEEIEIKPLVLCEECKFWDVEETITGKRFCRQIGCCVLAKWFCADGEQKEGDIDAAD